MQLVMSLVKALVQQEDLLDVMLAAMTMLIAQKDAAHVMYHVWTLALLMDQLDVMHVQLVTTMHLKVPLTARPATRTVMHKAVLEEQQLIALPVQVVDISEMMIMSAWSVTQIV